MAFWPFSSTKKAKPYGVIDLSGSSVGYAQVTTKLEHGQSCPIIGASSRVKTIKQGFDLERFSNSTEQMVQSILENEVRGIPQHFYCFLPSVFYLNQSRITNFQPAEGQVKVTRKLINDIVQAEAQKFKIGVSSSSQSRIIENRIMSIKLNGYEVTDPFGKEARSIQIMQYVATAPEKILTTIEKAVAKASHQDKVFFHSGLFALFSTMRDLIGDKNFVLIDVSGELTDVVVITQGVIMDTATFPLGKNHLVRRLSRRAGGLQAAISMLSTISHGSLIHNHDASEVIQKSKEDWVRSCQQSLETLASRTLIPENFFVVSDDNLAGIFSGWLGDPVIAKIPVSTSKPLSIQVIGSHLFKGFCEGSELRDHLLMAECLFCDKLENNQT